MMEQESAFTAHGSTPSSASVVSGTSGTSGSADQAAASNAPTISVMGPDGLNQSLETAHGGAPGSAVSSEVTGSGSAPSTATSHRPAAVIRESLTLFLHGRCDR